MADLHDPGELALADVAHPFAQRLQVRQRLVVCGAAAGDDQAEPPRLDHLAVAADRRREQRAPRGRGGGANLAGGLLRDSGAIDQDLRCHGPRQHPAWPDRDLQQVVRGGDHGEHDVAVGERRGRIDQAPTSGHQRLRLGSRAVVDGDVGALLEQPACHRKAHPAGADPAELVLAQIRVCHSGHLAQTFAPRERGS